MFENYVGIHITLILRKTLRKVMVGGLQRWRDVNEAYWMQSDGTSILRT